VKSAVVLIAGCAFLIASGCENNRGLTTTIWDQNKELRQQKSDLKVQLEKLQARNEQLQEQVMVLSKLPADINLGELYGLEKLIIAKRTGFYDKDKDGKKEKLIVYLRPIDKEGDALKAAGEVQVGLWDLNQKPRKALLAEWHIEPAELKKMWVGGMLTHYYRLSFDFAGQIEGGKELTVKVRFTDHLTGKVLTTQAAVKP
jgi:hypothetical protein